MIKTYLKTLFLLFFICLALPVLSSSKTISSSGFENFITVKGNKLMEGGNEFRFISYNIPTLNFNEDEFEFSHLHAYSLPDEFELRDIFETVRQMGGKVVRLYTIPAKLAFEPENTPTYVLAPNTFSEEAFKTMDLVLALANEYNIRIIFSVLNNWQWMGGRPQYAAFRGKTAEEFWTDRQLIDDFKATVKYTINRTNTITGIQYKNDKAIMCWETGNELSSPLEWTIEICRYIKSLDSNHLIIDGYNASAQTPLREGSILEPSIDIIQSHHYEINPAEFIENVTRNIATINKRKPYIIEEFGFVGTPAIEQYINKIIDSDVSGMLLWGLRGHRSKGGFFWHSEPLGFGRYKSYHWPGFDSGNEYDETKLMKLMCEKAYEINGETPPTLPVPKAPELLPIDQVSCINWKGSSGASFYDLYRSKSPDGQWEIIGFNLSDANKQYFPLFNDRDAMIGETYFYKLIAKNQIGNSLPSKVVGPIKVKNKALIDDMENFGELYSSSMDITLESSDDRKFKEDMFRLKGVEGDEMVYYVPGNINEMKIYSYCKEDTVNLKFEISSDNQNYIPVKTERMSYNDGRGDYDYWVPIAYQFKTESQNHYLKINFTRETQVSRLELYYN